MPSLWVRTVEGVVLLPLPRGGATVRVTDEKCRRGQCILGMAAPVGGRGVVRHHHRRGGAPEGDGGHHGLVGRGGEGPTPIGQLELIALNLGGGENTDCHTCVITHTGADWQRHTLFYLTSDTFTLS